MKRFYNYLIQSTSIAVILFVAGLLFLKNADVQWFHAGYIYVLIGYLLFTWGIQYTLYVYATKKLALFNRAFMIVTGVKLMALITLMLILAVVIPSYFKYFLGEILLLYFLFSIIETRDILSFTKKKK